MAGVIESFRRFYSDENFTKNVMLFLFVFILSILSTIFDIQIGKPDTMRQNPFDWAMSLLVGVYSLLFLNQALKNPSFAMLPQFNSLSKKAFGGMIALNSLWTIYALIAIIIGAIWYFATKDIILPILLGTALCVVASFAPLIYIRFAENFELKGLFDIRLLFRIIGAAFKPVMLQILKFILLALFVVVLYFGGNILGDLFNLTNVYEYATVTSLFDTFMISLFCYVFVVILLFIFPYSLVDIYLEKIRPLFPGASLPEEITEQNV